MKSIQIIDGKLKSWKFGVIGYPLTPLVGGPCRLVYYIIYKYIHVFRTQLAAHPPPHLHTTSIGPTEIDPFSAIVLLQQFPSVPDARAAPLSRLFHLRSRSRIAIGKLRSYSILIL